MTHNYSIGLDARAFDDVDSYQNSCFIDYSKVTWRPKGAKRSIGLLQIPVRKETPWQKEIRQKVECSNLCTGKNISRETSIEVLVRSLNMQGGYNVSVLLCVTSRYTLTLNEKPLKRMKLRVTLGNTNIIEF